MESGRLATVIIIKVRKRYCIHTQRRRTLSDKRAFARSKFAKEEAEDEKKKERKLERQSVICVPSFAAADSPPHTHTLYRFLPVRRF